MTLPAIASSAGASRRDAGVAFWAHVGGFASGMLLAKPSGAQSRSIRRTGQSERRDSARTIRAVDVQLARVGWRASTDWRRKCEETSMSKLAVMVFEDEKKACEP